MSWKFSCNKKGVKLLTTGKSIVPLNILLELILIKNGAD